MTMSNARLNSRAGRLPACVFTLFNAYALLPVKLNKTRACNSIVLRCNRCSARVTIETYDLFELGLGTDTPIL